MTGHDHFDRSRRSAWTTWVPLAVTVTAAAVGLAAWILTQRRDEEDAEGAWQRPRNGSNDSSDTEDADAQRRPTRASEAAESGEWTPRASRMASPVGAMLDSAGRKVSAGMAAAGAVVGSALAAITEDQRSAAASSSEDEAWSGGAPSPAPGAASMQTPAAPGRRRRTVAVVISAEGLGAAGPGDGFVEHASLLSHIPRRIDFSTTKLFVLIYAPGLSQGGDADPTSNLPALSISSSYSNIGPDQLESPNQSPKSPFSSPSSTSAYQALHDQAVALVEDKTMVLPFTTPKGFTYMLRHLEQDLDAIYLQESLAGDDGAWVNTLQLWFRREIVLVVGAEAGDGGLADSDDSDGEVDGREVWWKKPERVGRGRGVVVVEAVRLGDDWARRVQGME